MCSKLENWKGLKKKSFFGKWCHWTCFIISRAGSEGFNFARLAPPGLSQLLSSGLPFNQCGTTLNCLKRLKFVLLAMAGWNITEFKDCGHHNLCPVPGTAHTCKKIAASKRLKSSFCCKMICLQVKKDGKYWLKEAYPSSTHPSGTQCTALSP